MNILTKLSGTKNRISLNRIFAKAMGKSVEGGLFIEEVMYWSERTSDEDGWFWVDSEHWENEYFLSKYQINKFAKIGIDNGFIEKKRKKINKAPRIFLRFNEAAFIEFVKAFLESENDGVFDYEIFNNQNLDYEKFDNPMDYEKFDNPIYIDPLNRFHNKILSDKSDGNESFESEPESEPEPESKPKPKKKDDTVSPEERAIRDRMRTVICWMMFKHQNTDEMGMHKIDVNKTIKRWRESDTPYTPETLTYWWDNVWANEWQNKDIRDRSLYQSPTWQKIKTTMATAYLQMHKIDVVGEILGDSTADAQNQSTQIMSKTMFDRVPAI